jgi:hypothetical protein
MTAQRTWDYVITGQKQRGGVEGRVPTSGGGEYGSEYSSLKSVQVLLLPVLRFTTASG